MGADSKNFIDSLKNNDLEGIKKIPKADLHNHFVLGGNRDYIYRKKNILINPISKPLSSISEMESWNGKYIGSKFNDSDMRKFLIESAFIQAEQDGVKILEIGEDVWGLKEFFHNDIAELIETFQEINEKAAPQVTLRLQIGLSRHCPIEYLMGCLESFWGHSEFYSIDLYGDECAQPIENFIPIYRKAEEYGLRLKAHIGEWGTADDIINGVERLHLDEVQHGIAASESKYAMEFLKENNIRLNITPTSNVMLGRVKNIGSHPIAKLFRNNVDVTINSDDVLIFDSDVSKEYLRLFNSGCMSAEELDAVRINGLKNI